MDSSPRQASAAISLTKGSSRHVQRPSRAMASSGGSSAPPLVASRIGEWNLTGFGGCACCSGWDVMLESGVAHGPSPCEGVLLHSAVVYQVFSCPSEHLD